MFRHYAEGISLSIRFFVLRKKGGYGGGPMHVVDLIFFPAVSLLGANWDRVYKLALILKVFTVSGGASPYRCGRSIDGDMRYWFIPYYFISLIKDAWWVCPILIITWIFTHVLHVMCLQLPTTIADNAGYDSADLIAKLRAVHTEGKHTYGLSK